MPCNSDYLEPNERERQLQRTAELLVYVNNRLGLPSPIDLQAAARNTYCRADFVPQLCERVRTMNDEQQAAIMYDGRNPQARNLADWWETHQAADKARLEQEARQAEKQALRAQALAKLTPAERQALGVFQEKPQ